ncbi:carbohydrate abc transporter substrate-binding cut1 family [Leptolyngbya sp. Heron Island J]|uniref:ABC transporter substrate-binding protein n=1 Tax=Leptolyngbya sp. Heron Island J TaxID=1385935 RepID=UPI0003B9F573|nr:ABC transporter substrate-binding protein [Leptolyngbya sp. Heron Island J]ESA34975.1 carbohydrate abc transporter substrate-binding cut1 family [Leptolyngbya sp. Heron Island J]
MKRRKFTQLSLCGLGGLAISCASEQQPANTIKATSGDTLKIWWQEGFYPEEIDALKQIIEQWKAQSQVDVELSVIPQKDILAALERALATNTDDIPDIFYSGSADLTTIPRLAWNGELVDVSDVIQSVENYYTTDVLSGVNYQNKTAGTRSFYAVPLMQSAIHIHYWEDLLINAIGERRATIPKDWQGFWDFWQSAHTRLQASQGAEIYSVGMPMSLSLDTYNNFEQFLEAHSVSVLDEAGNFAITETNRAALVDAIADYARFYLNGTVPPDSVDWDNTGNNVSLLSRKSLMTVNHTLSAPGSQRSDSETYYKKLSTVEWPSKPDGRPMRYVIEIKQAVLLAQSTQQTAAKDFLTFLAQPNNLSAYTKGAQGRYLPVMPDLFEDGFWQEQQDTHISVAVKQLQNTRPAYQVLNPAYGEVAAQNVWGQIMNKIATGELDSNAAADEAIATIQTIFDDWQ